MQLGKLEKQILQHLWRSSPASAKDVHADFSKQREGSLNTIQSALDRLFKKQLLQREESGHAWQYSPLLERRELIAKIIEQATEDFVQAEESGLLAAFTTLSESLEESELDTLEGLIQQRRKELKNLASSGASNA